MKATNIPYSFDESDDRIRDILNSSDQGFEELNEIPISERLTFVNGFYVNCAALFIDIRGSSKLPENHTRPVLGKIYRSYISECVALMNQDENCREIFIEGDCVSGIFNAPYKNNIDAVFFRAAQLNNLIKLLNWRLEQKGYTPIKCGIGLAYGRALMLKAGFKGSAINDIVWMGDVVNTAANLCHQGNKDDRKPIQVSSGIFTNLSSENQRLLSPVYTSLASLLEGPDQYETNLIDPAMEKWISDQKAKAQALASLFGTPSISRNGLLGLGLRASGRGFFDL
jgi:class 3 adenylate cyclase